MIFVLHLVGAKKLFFNNVLERLTGHVLGLFLALGLFLGLSVIVGVLMGG